MSVGFTGVGMDHDAASGDRPVWTASLVRPFVSETIKFQFPEFQGKWGGLYANCLESLGMAAVEKVKTSDADEFRREYLEPISHFIAWMQAAVAYEKPSPDFWRHNSLAVISAKNGEASTIYRDSLERAVGKYLALPVRSRLVDRTLIDILLATEVYAFASKIFGKLNTRSQTQTMKIRGPLDYLTKSWWHNLFAFVPIGLVYGAWYLDLLSRGWRETLAVLIYVLFLLEENYALFRLPFGWLVQIRNKARIWEMMDTMQGVYSEMESAGLISALHIRECAQAASAAGVRWPPTLFVLLDDVIAREGHL